VVVEERKKFANLPNTKSSNFLQRRQLSYEEKPKPAVDLPLQFNFGSPYSSSLTIFFDFEAFDKKLKKGTI